MNCRIFGAVLATALLFGATSAKAGHIQYTNVQLNGVALDSIGGFTDPMLMGQIGDNFALTVDAFGSTSDNLVLDFTAGGGSTLAITDTSIPYTGGSGTSGSPITIAYNFSFGAAGLFDGDVEIDFPVS